jgi:hypothetical protein
MSTLDELKRTWEEKQAALADYPAYEPASLERMIRTRIKKHLKTSVKYFWASLALQILVYSMLTHVIIKYWPDEEVRYFSIAGILLFLPFTITFMRKFKRLAAAKIPPQGNAVNSIHDYIVYQLAQLRSFYQFKKWYDFFLTPLSAAIGVALIFKLYVPGGVQAYWNSAVIIFVITLLTCIAAIRKENRESFKEPIRQLLDILDEFRS